MFMHIKGFEGRLISLLLSRHHNNVTNDSQHFRVPKESKALVQSSALKGMQRKQTCECAVKTRHIFLEGQ